MTPIRSLALMAVLFPTPLFAADPPRANPPGKISPEIIARLVEQSRTAWQVPGIAVVIVQGDQLLYKAAHGRRQFDHPEPLTTTQLFPLASCSKAFTTTLMAMLVDDRKLNWDDPVRRHLPNFHLSDPAADALVSVRDLVSHRTGLSNHDLLWYRAPWTIEEMVERSGKLPLSYPFRSGFAYQSTMFSAAGLVCGKAGDKPWEELIRERILTPLAMRDAGVRTTDAPLERRVSGHLRKDDGTLVSVPWYPQEVANAAGSIHATADDCVPWLQFLANGGTIAGRRLVSEANLRQTMTAQTLMPFEGLEQALSPETVQMTYGMGWVIQDYRGRRQLAHGGTIDGFRVHLTIIPEAKIGIALLNNLHLTKMNQILSNKLVDHLFDLPSRDWDAIGLKAVVDDAKRKADAEARHQRERRADSLPTFALARYAGRYRHPVYGLAQVEFVAGKLMWKYHGFHGPLEHDEHDSFDFRDSLFGNDRFRFFVNPDGVLGVLAQGIPFERLPNLPMP